MFLFKEVVEIKCIKRLFDFSISKIFDDNYGGRHDKKLFKTTLIKVKKQYRLVIGKKAFKMGEL